MKIYLVGGAVRDQLLGLPIQECDYVVVGATVQEMLDLGFRQVGKDFPVFLHPRTNEEYALARRERKIDRGYKGFSFDTSTNVTLQDDLLRRDLTINAMAMTLEGELIDPYHGKADLENNVLRHVSDAFKEDPVRILRIGRFLARFAYLGFHVAEETVALMQAMVKAGEVDALVPERVWKEFERALGEKNPEQFFEVLAKAQALSILFPTISLNGDGMKALKAAAQHESKTIVRFAALVFDHDKQGIYELVKTLRLPNAYRELALLTTANYQTLLNFKQLSAEEIVDLFNKMDIYRRKSRFYDCLEAVQAIAEALEKPFHADTIRSAAQILSAVDIAALIASGLSNHALATAIKEKRCEKIAAWLKAL